MAEEPKPTETNPQDPTPNESGNETRTFTQADVDRIVSDRLARERKNHSCHQAGLHGSWAKPGQTIIIKI